MSDESFRTALDRMLAEASERVERDFVGGGYDFPDVREAASRAGFGPAQEKVTVTASYASAYIPVSTEQALDAGVITEEEACARGWTPPPPPTRRDRLRWRWQAWRERAGRKVGGWIAGVDLSERDEDW